MLIVGYWGESEGVYLFMKVERRSKDRNIRAGVTSAPGAIVERHRVQLSPDTSPESHCASVIST